MRCCRCCRCCNVCMCGCNCHGCNYPMPICNLNYNILRTNIIQPATFSSFMIVNNQIIRNCCN